MIETKYLLWTEEFEAITRPDITDSAHAAYGAQTVRVDSISFENFLVDMYTDGLAKNQVTPIGSITYKYILGQFALKIDR